MDKKLFLKKKKNLCRISQVVQTKIVIIVVLKIQKFKIKKDNHLTKNNKINKI